MLTQRVGMLIGRSSIHDLDRHPFNRRVARFTEGTRQRLGDPFHIHGPAAKRVAPRGEAGEERGVGTVEPLAGLLVDGAARLGARTVVRGVRNATDLEYERQMAHTNRAMAPWLDTVLLLSSPEHAHVSSTLVRQIARLGGDVRLFVPPQVAEALRVKLQDPAKNPAKDPTP